MKKNLFLLIVVLLTTTSNAQLWIGGSVGFSHENSVDKANHNEVEETSNSISLSPMLGKDLNDKLSIGGEVDFIYASLKGPDAFSSKESKESTSAFGFAPFARYSFVEFGKFRLVGEASLPVVFASFKERSGSVIVGGSKSTTIGLSFEPLLTYSLNDRVSLECGLDFLSLNFTHSVVKDRDDSSTRTVKDTFNFGVNAHSITTLGQLKIGFTYRL